MKTAPAPHRPGNTQQRLLRHLLQAPQGANVEELCNALGISHNAVRQHLTALIAAAWVGRGERRASGGRPRSVYMLLPAGRELFPRNYASIAHSMLEHLYAHAGMPVVQKMLVEMGTALGSSVARGVETAPGTHAIANALAEQLDALGYEAQAVQQGPHGEVHAWNCVFHGLAKAHPDVCRFDLAFMEAASGHRIQHAECMLRGGQVCRFRIGNAIPAPG